MYNGTGTYGLLTNDGNYYYLAIDRTVPPVCICLCFCCFVVPVVVYRTKPRTHPGTYVTYLPYYLLTLRLTPSSSTIDTTSTTNI